MCYSVTNDKITHYNEIIPFQTYNFFLNNPYKKESYRPSSEETR